MNERDLQVLEQYPFTVNGSWRTRGAFLLTVPPFLIFSKISTLQGAIFYSAHICIEGTRRLMRGGIL